MGFDRFFGYNCQRHAHSFYPNYLWSDDKRIKLDNNPPIPGHAKLPNNVDPTDPKSYDRYKGKDYAAEGLGDMSGNTPPKRRGGQPGYRPPRPALTKDRVRHVGQAIAVVIGETVNAAKDAVEAIDEIAHAS